MKSRPRRAAAKKAVKESSQEESGSEWSEQSPPSSEEEEESYEDEEEEEEEEESYSDDEPPPKKQQKKKPPKKTASKPRASTAASKKRKRFEIDEFDDEEEGMPTHLRLTKRGGYAHTKSSRARISRANQGNIPWNKHKGWSEDVKARIKAGVQATNRAKLLAKIKKLGMEEEEYDNVRKKIKYQREKVRKLKVKVKKLGDEGGQLTLPEPESAHEEEEEVDAPEPKDENKLLFPREIRWTPHPFDTQEQAYQNTCPIGGPGGLICCEPCIRSYSQYMTQTVQDVEEQTNSSLAHEIKEVIGFVEKAKRELQEAVRVAGKNPPPPKLRAAVNGTIEDSIVATNSSTISWDLTDHMYRRGDKRV